MKHQIIPKPNTGRRFAIADIHGCSKTFKYLVQNKIKLEKDDQLFLLGDYINRGPDNKGVIDFILALKTQNFQVFTLRGNHEKQFLMAYDCGMEFFQNFLSHYHSLDLMSENLETYLKFCENTKYYLFIEGFFLSHCGIQQENGTALTDIRTMFSEANITLDKTLLENSYHIYGHKSNALEKICKNIAQKNKNLNLDAGCVYKNKEGLGFLCALNLDTFDLLIQENIEDNHS